MKKQLLTILLAVFAFGTFAQMPNAITISPENSSAWDELTLTFNATLSCTPDGKDDLLGLTTIAMHSAAILITDDQNSWGSLGVDYNGQPGGEYTTTLTNNGDDTYSMKFVPAVYYGVPEGSIVTRISAVFNNGSGWTAEGKDYAEDGCGDFFIPLYYESTVPALHFIVNMSKMYEDGNFDPGADEVFAVVDGFSALSLIDLDENFEVDRIYEGLLDEGLEEGQTYTFKFRIGDAQHETVDRSITPAAGTNIIEAWWNDEIGTILDDILFTVNMGFQIEAGNFNPATDYVDVAGSMNSWDGANHHLTSDNDSIYSVVIESQTAGTVVEYKYRLNGDWETSEFPDGGANRKFTVRESGSTTRDIYDNYRPGWAPLNLSVNMNYVLTTVMSADDFVDVAGSLNGWGASDELWDTDANGIYIGSVLAEIGADIEYKFRINASWDNLYHEFPSGGPARPYTVLDTAGGIVNDLDTVWFNDWDPTTAAAPMAQNVSIGGTQSVGKVLTGHYSYVDVNGDVEGTSTFRWYRANDNTGVDSTVIDGATSLEYTLTDDDLGKYVFFEVTPVAVTSTPDGDLLTGIAVSVSKGPIWATNIITIGHESVTLYPNPVSRTLIIDNADGFINVIISNIIGQKILSQKINSNQVEVNTSDLEKGIYFITLINEKGYRISQKIIKN